MESTELDALLDRHRDRFRELHREIVEEELGDNPFRLPLDEFLARSEDERAALVRRAAHLARARVDRELDERGAAWVVLVGDEIVADSRGAHGIPTVDEVLELGRSRNLVPYLLEAPLIEELPASSAWQPVDTGILNDRYPTLPIRIGHVALEADLDTGSHGTFADERLGRRAPASVVRGPSSRA